MKGNRISPDGSTGPTTSTITVNGNLLSVRSMRLGQQVGMDFILGSLNKNGQARVSNNSGGVSAKMLFTYDVKTNQLSRKGTINRDGRKTVIEETSVK
jgi:hypothetical protein